MPDRPFDISVKDLAEEDPLSWSRLHEKRQVDSATSIDADISTVTASPDKVLRAQNATGTWLVNLEAVSTHDGDLPGRVHLKSAMLEARHRLPVRSVVVLLRREATARAITGVLNARLPGETKVYDTFRYEVVRLWRMPMESLLTGGLGTLPLAALTDEARPQLREVVQQIETRLRSEAIPTIADKTRASLFLLLGLRYEAEMIEQLYQGLVNMEESTTYQSIIRKGEERGRVNADRRALLVVGSQILGVADASVQQQLAAVADPIVLERLLERVATVSTWSELLADIRR